jgi:hypothetical protein
MELAVLAGESVDQSTVLLVQFAVARLGVGQAFKATGLLRFFPICDTLGGLLIEGPCLSGRAPFFGQ